MDLIINRDGVVRCLYDESLDLRSLGRLSIRRASYVEPAADATWDVDLSPVGGPCLKAFATRSAALAAERQWLLEHHLPPVR